MLRMISLGLLGWSSLAVAQVPPAPSAPAVPAAAADAVPVEPPVEAEPVVAEPAMKKVCRPVEVVGSSIPRRVCTMKPVRAPKATADR